MHELSIAQSILSIAGDTAMRYNNGLVNQINLEIGELSGIETGPLEFAFSVIKNDTILQNADLNIQIIEGEAECTSCNEIFPIHSLGSLCPHCQGYDLKIRKGREMRILNIIIDE